jgi:hypothetical protein
MMPDISEVAKVVDEVNEIIQKAAHERVEKFLQENPEANLEDYTLVYSQKTFEGLWDIDSKGFIQIDLEAVKKFYPEIRKKSELK